MRPPAGPALRRATATTARRRSRPEFVDRLASRWGRRGGGRRAQTSLRPLRGVGNRATCGSEEYGLEHICCTSYIDDVLIDWTRDFGDWLDQVTERADRGDRHSQLMLELVTAELSVLQDLTSMPDVETPTLRRVRQSGRNPVWRVGHPYVSGAAVRLIVWFPPERPEDVVVALFANDKAQMGDVFYEASAPVPT
jgi:hypothetical protein